MIAVVATYNRRELLLGCLDALARQTRPIAALVVLDNASTDGTEEALRTAPIVALCPVHYLRLPRNGGATEGNHFGIRWALQLGCDWVWVLDNDAEPEPDALELLLGAPAAARADTVLLAPKIVTADGRPQLLHRGTLVRRLLAPPMRPLAISEYREGAQLGYASYLGVLVRASAVERAGLPRREMFVWMDDVDFTERLSHVGALRLVPTATVRHYEARPRIGETLGERLRIYAKPLAFAGLWRNLYGLRNLISWGRRTGYVGALATACYAGQHLARVLLFDPDKRLRARLVVEFARQGWRGEAFNLDPDEWPSLEQASAPLAWLHEHAIDHTADYGPPVLLVPR